MNINELYLPHNVERRFKSFCKINRVSEHEAINFIITDYFKLLDDNPTTARMINREKLMHDSDFGDIKSLW